MGNRLSKEEFIDKAVTKHGSTYDYKKVVFIDTKTKVIITCQIHGDFLQSPSNHLSGNGCNLCGIMKTHILQNQKSRNDFKNKATIVHKGLYNYDKSVYINATDKVEIICGKHGSFWQRPADHVRGIGCNKCGDEVRRVKNLKGTKEDFVSKAIDVHLGNYSYEKVDYKGITSKVEITCKSHGSFFQTPFLHLEGQGCKKCHHAAIIKECSKTFIGKCQEIHGIQKYDYSEVIYKSSKDKVKIICKDHGEFWQAADSHLKGHGCPNCHSNGFQRDKPTYLYVLETSGGFVGFGITGKLNKRMTTHRRHLRSKGISISKMHIFEGYGENVLEAESYIKRTFANSNVFIEGFKTEAFTNDRLPLVLEYLRSRDDLK